jgi:hypothetical protein
MHVKENQGPIDIGVPNISYFILEITIGINPNLPKTSQIEIQYMSLW